MSSNEWVVTQILVNGYIRVTTPHGNETGYFAADKNGNVVIRLGQRPV